MAPEADQSKPHVLAFPSFPHGHAHPMMLLCEALASPGTLSITFVKTQRLHHSVLPLLPRNPNIQILSISGHQPPPSQQNSTPAQMLADLENHMQTQLQQIIVGFHRTANPVTCFIADLCWSWPHILAKKLSIPMVAGFTPFCLANLYLVHNLPNLISTGQLLPNGSPTGNTISLPALPLFRSARRPWRMGYTEEIDQMQFQNSLKLLEQVRDLKWILCNTCYDWESPVADALSKELPVLAVGPLFLAAEKTQEMKTHPPLSQEGKECLEWLDKQAASSVIYIAFGSLSSLSRAQIHELSLGLEASGSPFLWVLRPDLSGTDPLPEGFVERTRDRAHFVSWAPQTLVMAHSSIACYLFHSGWNSMAESICLGVPMLAMSFDGDQRMNYSYLVEEWGVAKALRDEDEQNGELCRQEVEKAIRCVMSGCEEGKEIRRRVRKMQEAAMAAVQDGGSSYNNLQAFMQEIIKHSHD